MTPEERQRAIARYAERLRRLGPVVQSLGWRDRDQQYLRFDIMLSGLPDLTGASVLDIGCGFGDFHGFLSERGVRARYVGCDISPDVLAVATARHGAGASFDLRDPLVEPYADASFDVAVISGIFNYRLSDNQSFLERMLTAAFKCTRVAVAANMMTDQVDYEDEALYYFNPERVLGFCRTLTRHVALRQDYPLYELTAFVYRQARGTTWSMNPAERS